MATAFYSQPTAAFGYWRGGMSDGPLWKGQGSNMGLKAQGANLFSAGTGATPGGGGGWEPTVIYLLILIVAEMVVFGAISRLLR